MSRPERIQATDTEKTGTPQFGSVAEDAVKVSLLMGSEGPAFQEKVQTFRVMSRQISCSTSVKTQTSEDQGNEPEPAYEKSEYHTRDGHCLLWPSPKGASGCARTRTWLCRRRRGGRTRRSLAPHCGQLQRSGWLVCPVEQYR